MLSLVAVILNSEFSLEQLLCHAEQNSETYSADVLDFAKGLKCQQSDSFLFFLIFFQKDAGRRSHFNLALGTSAQNSAWCGTWFQPGLGQELACFCSFPLIFPKTNLTSYLNIHEWGSKRPPASLASRSNTLGQMLSWSGSVQKDNLFSICLYHTEFYCLDWTPITLPLLNSWAMYLKGINSVSTVCSGSSQGVSCWVFGCF